MTFDELWEAVVKKNPDWKQDEYVFKTNAANMRKAMKTAYDQGEARQRNLNASKDKLRESVGNPFPFPFGF